MPDTSLGVPQPSRPWFMRGARAAFTLPGLILCSAFVGFGSLAREAGFSLPEALTMVLTIWALPSMVVLVGAIQAGAVLPAAALAVTLSAVRLMPMVMSLVPEMRSRNTRPWVLYLLSHFIAVTSWVMSFQRFPAMPREARTSFYAGLAAVLMVNQLVVVTVTFLLLQQLPPGMAAALLLLTPMYFLCSMWTAARERAGQVALALGVVLGPAFHLVLPEADLLLAGFVGGGFAYALHRLAKRKSVP